MSIPPISTTIIVKDEASKAFEAMTQAITKASEMFDSFYAKLSESESFTSLSESVQEEASKIKVALNEALNPESIKTEAIVEETSKITEALNEALNPESIKTEAVVEKVEKASSDMVKAISTNLAPLPPKTNSINNQLGMSFLDLSIKTHATFQRIGWRVGGVFGKMGEIGKGVITRLTPAFERLRNRMEKVFNFAGKINLSLASIGQAYWGIMGIAAGANQFAGIFREADSVTRMTSRINLLTNEQKKGYSTQQIDASFGRTANVLGVDKGQFAESAMSLLTGTGGAFQNIKEASKFSELLSKQFAISGVSAEAAASATEQLRQGLSKGALQGQDLKSILSAAPQIIDLFAQKMGIATGEVIEAASAGKLTADIIKSALFENADIINSQFAQIPATWDRVMARLKNKFMDNMQPILDAVSSFAGSESFEVMSESVLKLSQIFVSLGQIIVNVFKPITPIFSWILDKFAFMVEAIQKNITLFSVMVGTFLSVVVALKLITGWQQLVITLQKIITATNPFLAIATVIIGATVALKHLYDTNADFQFQVRVGFEKIRHGIELGLTYLEQGFKWFVGSVIEGVGELLRSVQDILNSAMEVYAKIKGVDVERYTFASDIARYGYQMQDSAPFEKARAQMESEHMSRLLSYSEDWKNASSLAAQNVEKEDDEPLELAYGSSPSKPLHTKGTTKIDKDSIQLLKDIASVEIVNRYTTVRPRINAKFGDIHQTTDVDQLLTYLENDFSSKVESSLSPVGA